jgi:hypothetical protein
MRNTDPDPAPFQPLGEKVAAPPPPPADPKLIPGAASGIVIGPDGKMQTTKHRG